MKGKISQLCLSTHSRALHYSTTNTEKWKFALKSFAIIIIIIIIIIIPLSGPS
jgi:hypothetical protein